MHGYIQRSERNLHRVAGGNFWDMIGSEAWTLGEPLGEGESDDGLACKGSYPRTFSIQCIDRSALLIISVIWTQYRALANSHDDNVVDGNVDGVMDVRFR